MSGCSCLRGPQPGLREHALRYQKQGYAVLPLVPGGKKPHPVLGSRGGVHHATRDPAMPRQWWARDRLANIGVATGAVNQLAVIDLDVKGTADGTRNFWYWLRDNGHDGQAGWPWARTPSGGRHLWFRTPPGAAVPQRIGILPGVDIKGDGGYVAAPPSVGIVQIPRRPEERKEDGVPLPYRWESGCPCQIPDAPGWMADWISRSRAMSGSPGSNGTGLPPPDLARLVREGIPRGQRNTEMYRLACSRLRTYGLSAEGTRQAREEILAVWNATDHDGFPWHEVLTILRSAAQFVEGCEERDREAYRQMREMIIWDK